MSIQGIKKAVREIHSEPGPNGTLSWGRVAATLSLFATFAWVTRVLVHTGALPYLGDAAAFATAPYAANKVGSAIQSFSNNPVSASIPSPTADSLKK